MLEKYNVNRLSTDERIRLEELAEKLRFDRMTDQEDKEMQGLLDKSKEPVSLTNLEDLVTPYFSYYF
jgi:hypothetical protein